MAKYTGENGKESATASLFVDDIDTKKPEITITADKDIIADMTSADKASISVSDDISGIKTATMTTPSGESVSIENGIDITERGKYVINAVDNIGNEVTKEITLRNVPEIITTPEVSRGSIVKGDVEVKVTGDIEQGGFTVNGETVSAKTYTAKAKTFDSISYSINVTDKYGYAKTLNFTIDDTVLDAPTLTITPDTTDYVQGPVKVTVDASTVMEGADVKYEVIYMDGNGNVEESAYPNGGIEVDRNATVNVWYVTADKSSAKAVAKITNIDETAPVLSVDSGEKKVVIDNKQTSANSVTVSANDTESGIDKLEYKLRTATTYKETSSNIMTITEPGTYDIKATNKAGLVSEDEITIFAKPSINTNPKIVNGQTSSKAVIISKGSVGHSSTELTVNGTVVNESYTAGQDENGRQEDGSYYAVAKDKFGSIVELRFSIEYGIPEAPSIILSTTAPTNNDVDAAVVLPTSANLSTHTYKLYYRVDYVDTSLYADGEDNETIHSYTTPVALKGNATLTAWYTREEIGVDDAKLERSEEVSATIDNIDKHSPELFVESGEDGIIIGSDDKTSASSINVYATDEGLGIKSIGYRFGTEDAKFVDIAKDSATRLTAKGTYYFTVEDMAGNKDTKVVTLVEKPEFTLTPEVDDGMTVASPVTVTSKDMDKVTITDANNNNVTLDENSQITADGTYTVKIPDVYGYSRQLCYFHYGK